MRLRLDVAAAKVSFDATRAAASLHGELLRFAGGADQAGLVAQVEAIAQTVIELLVMQNDIAVAVETNTSRHRRIAGARQAGDGGAGDGGPGAGRICR